MTICTEIYKKLEKNNFRFNKSLKEKYKKYLSELMTKYDTEKPQEAFYLEYYSETPYCKNGKRMNFNTFRTGFNNCGRGKNVCKCWYENVSSGINNFWDNITDDRKNEYFDKHKKTCIERYGVENPSQSEDAKEKRKETCIERYGVEHFSKTDVFKDKYTTTSLERYGVENPSQTKEVKEKRKETVVERYGVEHFSKTDVFKDKFTKTSLERYNTPHPMQSKKIKEKISKNNIEKYGTSSHRRKNYINNYKNLFTDIDKFTEELNEHGTYELAELMNCDVSTVHLFARNNNVPLPNRPLSRYERQIIKLLDSKNIDYEFNAKTIIENYELDFYLPDLKIAFEFNGLYWHSDAFKNKNYHFDKWKKCAEKNIALYSIFEDDFINNSGLWENKILHLLHKGEYNKIHARKCCVREIDSRLCNVFLKDNHLQGTANSSIKIGLFHNDNLVSVMTFANTRNNKHRIIELSRFCSKKDIQVLGGASKMLSFFIKTYGNGYDEIISFSDNTYSDGNIYNKLGFTNVKNLGPDYKYIIDRARVHKSNFRKPQIKNKFDLDPDFVNTHTENELMNTLGIHRIWDCGKKKWSLKIK